MVRKHSNNFQTLIFMQDITDAIRTKNLEIQTEKDPQRKQDLMKQLQALNLKKEIVAIRQRIKQIS